VKIEGGFKDAGTLADGASFDADVCIVGSGAGGAPVAAALQAAGLQVIVLEEGGHHTKPEFRMREDQAFPMLYQQAGQRATKDLGISILQGRAVGGSTVINWTTSFRTPETVLEHWRTVHGVSGLSKAVLDPHWDAIEARLSIHQASPEDVNRNNGTLYDGCKALGFAVERTFRNVKGCMKSGYCGMGCPVDAKQSMLVTYLPDAVAKGAMVLARCRVDRLGLAAGKVERAECSVLGADGYATTGAKVTVRAKRFILSAGAINTPAILIRSGLGGGLVGRRTFLHPVVGTASKFRDPIEPYYGAPQSVASHQFANRGDEPGFFMEAAPIHPMLAALSMTGYGDGHRRAMADLPNVSAHIALAMDGFHPSEQGGTVEVAKSGMPTLAYELPPRIWRTLKEGLRTLIRIDLAAGAEWVASGHDPPLQFTSERDLARLDGAAFESGKIAVFSAHVMGGAKLGDDPAQSVVRSSDLRHHTVENLHVCDGSIFPTSLGVNPQESIYGIAHLMGERLAQAWTH
jgi:choline dehydrogenase-like flavoprotein